MLAGYDIPGIICRDIHFHSVHWSNTVAHPLSLWAMSPWWKNEFPRPCMNSPARLRGSGLGRDTYHKLTSFFKIIITFRERERGREIGKAFIQRVFSFLLSLSEPFWLMMLSPQSHRLKKILWGNVKFVCSYCRSVVRLVDVSGVYRATVGFIYDAELLLIHFEIAQFHLCILKMFSCIFLKHWYKHSSS